MSVVTGSPASSFTRAKGREAHFEAMATEGAAASSIGFVEGGLRDKLDREFGADFSELGGDREGELVGFDDAGPGD